MRVARRLPAPRLRDVAAAGPTDVRADQLLHQSLRAVATDVPASEIELKLTVPAAALRRLAAHRLLRGRSRADKKRLYSVYYDTPALDLWRKGVALRLRREG